MRRPVRKNALYQTFLGGLLALALSGGLYFYHQYQAAHDQRSLSSLFGLRQSFVAYVETINTIRYIEEVDSEAGLTVEQQQTMARNLEFLRLRLHEIQRSDTSALNRSQQQFIDTFAEFVGTLEVAAAKDFDDIDGLLEDLIAIERRISSQGIRLSNEQWFMQRDFVIAQHHAFDGMMLAAGATFTLFIAISGVVLIMFRREQAARLKITLAEEQARRLAYYDGLTNLINRRRFHELLNERISDDDDAAIAIVDADDFKKVNDTYGHDVGDALLREIATRLTKAAEDSGCIVARLGGDEFAVMVAGPTAISAIDQFCRRALAAAAAPFEVDNLVISPKLTIGAATSAVLSDEDGGRPQQLMKAADRALYAAKSDGKNRFMVFDRALASEVRRERALERDLNAAIKADAFTLVFQPQVDMETGRLVGLEALSRWRNHDEAIPPDLFVAAAERTGQVQEIDLCALRTSAEAMARWRADGLAPCCVSVNLSPLNFTGLAIVDHVAEILERYDLPPRLLRLEITENVVLQEFDRAAMVLERLSALGVAVALDDFGSGFSSIGHLRRLKLDELKIDRSLITDQINARENRALLSTMARLAAALEMHPVVEGVEAEYQRTALLELGFRTGQGFLFSRPLPPDETRELIASGRPLWRPNAAAS